MKSEKNEHKLSQTSIINTLKQRLSFNNIYREFELITNMTRNLEIKFKIFAKLDPIKQMTKEKIISIVKSIPFLTYAKTKERGEQHQYIKINYEDSNRILLVTGITKQAISQIVKQFNQSPPWILTYATHYKQNYSKIIATNGFWVSIETNSQETAARLKKFLRNKKKINDNHSQEGYKVQGRRIRIVILKEDFLSILIDAMTEIKSQIFLKQFRFANPPNERRKSQDQTVILAQTKKKNIIYKSILLNSYYSKSDIKDQQLSDGFSESNSLSSDILDSNKIKDLIETSQQGIQSQNNGEFIQQRQESKKQDENHSKTVQQQINLILAEIVESIKSNKEEQRPTAQKGLEKTEENIDFSIVQHQNIQNRVQKEDLQQPLNQQIIHNTKDIIEERNIIQDNPFIACEMFAPTEKQRLLSTATQAQQFQLSSIKFQIMKRLLKEFKNTKSTSQLIEIPPWAKSQTDQQRNRHRFYASLCRPKIKIVQKNFAFL